MARILIVDDDAGIRETIQCAVEDAGYDAVHATDGLAALDVLRESRERMVVLLDLMMPRLDGAGVLGAVAGDTELANRHAFILMTATHKTMSLAFVSLLSSMRVPLLRKPFNIDELIETIQQVAERVGV